MVCVVYGFYLTINRLWINFVCSSNFVPHSFSCYFINCVGLFFSYQPNSIFAWPLLNTCMCPAWIWTATHGIMHNQVGTSSIRWLWTNSRKWFICPLMHWILYVESKSRKCVVAIKMLITGLNDKWAAKHLRSNAKKELCIVNHQLFTVGNW